MKAYSGHPATLTTEAGRSASRKYLSCALPYAPRAVPGPVPRRGAAAIALTSMCHICSRPEAESLFSMNAPAHSSTAATVPAAVTALCLRIHSAAPVSRSRQTASATARESHPARLIEAGRTVTASTAETAAAQKGSRRMSTHRRYRLRRGLRLPAVRRERRTAPHRSPHTALCLTRYPRETAHDTATNPP